MDQDIGTQMQSSFWRRHRRLKWVAASLAVALAALTVVVAMALHRAEPILRSLIVEGLEARFHAHVELDSFHVSLVRGLTAEGKGLRIWPPAQAQGAAPSAGGPPPADKPIIQVDGFHFRAPLHFARGKPNHVSLVRIDGLTVDIPPQSHFIHISASPAGPSPKSPGALPQIGPQIVPQIVVDTIECVGARIIIETNKPNKLPLEFVIKRMTLTHVSADHPAAFTSVLTNPRPEGLVTTQGSVGPWTVDDPGQTPISGNYTFEHANLGTFKGIAGMMNSTGAYKGTLRNLRVDGQTDTPDFKLTDFGTPLPLHTTFHARVDGINGDTWLDMVDATLGQTRFTAVGKVIGVKRDDLSLKNDPKALGGHEIAVTVNVVRGQIQDFLRLTSHSGDSLLAGIITVKASLDILPGRQPIQDRMNLKGKFSLDEARFNDPKMQGRIGDLSERSLGKPKDVKSPEASDVRSTMQGNFSMAGGIIHLPNLTYMVPGAEIDLKGDYGVAGGTLNFAGDAKMEATVSHMVGGWKGFLLRPADRLFKHDGAGTELPIHIDGTRKDPHLGVDFKGIKHTSPERPGDPPSGDPNSADPH